MENRKDRLNQYMSSNLTSINQMIYGAQCSLTYLFYCFSYYLPVIFHALLYNNAWFIDQMLYN